MNIYYVNRHSKLKGPFDIIDSNRQHIIKVGDICLRDTVNGVAFYVVYNSSNSWNSCKLIGNGANDTLSDIGNTLLFSFDGLSRRKGNVALIKQIRACFREKVIDNFFCNAIDILEYRKDFWEGSLFPQFFASSQELVDRKEQKLSDASIDMNLYPSIFAKYLSEELQILLINCLNEGNELKEAYQILRTKHPELFRKALMKFLAENPSGTIFDKSTDAYVPTVIVKEVETPKTTSRNDRTLVFNEEIEDEPLETNERTCKYLSEIARQELFSIYEEVELATEYRKGDINARNKLVSANMRFVIGLAKQYLHRGLEFEDLLQEGFLGLINAVEHFDETIDFKLADYAQWWIKRYLTDAIVSKALLIKVPFSAQILHRKIWNFKKKYEQKYDFMPSIADMEIEGEHNFERISFLGGLPSNLRNICISCEDLDVFEDDRNDILDYENNEYDKYFVRSLLYCLSKRERDILIRSFGIGVREDSLEIIGEKYGLTRERVRQIKEKAIKKLREMVTAISTKRQLPVSQSTWEEDGSDQTVTAKNTEEAQTNREIKNTFSSASANIVLLTETKRRNPSEKNTVPEASNAIDRLDVEHVTVDTSDALPYSEVKAGVKQSDKEETDIEEIPPTWSFAENIRFAKRSKKILNCKCRVGLSRTGYYLILNRISVKLGDYPDGYEYNIGNIWIKRPIDDRGYRLVHEKGKIDYLIGYVIEKGETIVFTNPVNDVYSVTFDGKNVSDVRNGTTNSLKGEDVEKLLHAFDKKATSYKFFWFLAILEIYKENQEENITFKLILVKMIAKAWKYVFVLNGQFPKTDQLPTYLFNLLPLTKLDYFSSESEVENELNRNYAALNLKLKWESLLKNVPYRFLSPWIVFTTNDEVINISQSSESSCPYKLYSDHITIRESWKEAIVDNYNIIELFVEYGLDEYLKISPRTKEDCDFYSARFASLNKLLRGIKSHGEQKSVQIFLEKYKFLSTGDITPAELMIRMPESKYVIDSEGRKRVNIPGEMWSLKILDKLLANENMVDKYKNVHLLSRYGLENYLKAHKDEDGTQNLFKTRFVSMTQLLKAIKRNKGQKAVQHFLEKYDFPLTGEITPVELMAKIPMSQCMIDNEGRKRINIPGGMWSLDILEKMLSE